MLTFTIKLNEKVHINDDITFWVWKKGNDLKLSTVAPKDTKILRDKVKKRDQQRGKDERKV